MLIMGMIVGAAIALAALAMAVAACIHRRDRSTTDLKALEFGSVTVTDAGAGTGHEDARGSATRAAASSRVAPEASLFGSRQNNWTESDTLQLDPTVCMYSYWGSILCGWC